MSKRNVYIAGHCLTRGSQLQRAEERDMVLTSGHDVYCPQDNDEINNKAKLKDEPLAEKIVRHDTDAIKNADTVIIEPLPEAQGTICELGQIHGMKMMAEMIKNRVFNTNWSSMASMDKTMDDILYMCDEVINQEVFPHFEDIRRVPDITETGDRRSLGINQYIYGVCLDLTNGKGFYSMDEIQKILNHQPSLLSVPCIESEEDITIITE